MCRCRCSCSLFGAAFLGIVAVAPRFLRFKTQLTALPQVILGVENISIGNISEKAPPPKTRPRPLPPPRKPMKCVDEEPANDSQDWLQDGWFGSAPDERWRTVEAWAKYTYAEVFRTAHGARKKKCGKRNFLRINQICRPYGFGNCLLGLASILQLAILSNSIPLFFDMDPMFVSKVWQFRHGPWTVQCLKPCYRDQLRTAERWDLTWMREGFFGEVSGYVLDLSNQRGLIASVTKGIKYYGFEITMAPKFFKRSNKMFPEALTNASEFTFGTLDIAHRAFFQAVPSEVHQPRREIVNSASWAVTGPLIVVHVRRGDKKMETETEERKAEAMGVNCLQQVIKDLNKSEARVYIATTKRFAWTRFVDYFVLDSGGFATKNVDDRRVQFKVGPAVDEALSQSNRQQEASPNFFFDWYIISRADVLLRPPRTTFSTTAMAMGRPSQVYLYAIRKCMPVSFREACMHDKGHSRDVVLKHYRDPLVKGYFDYCRSIGESR